jgi:hypothetical protein
MKTVPRFEANLLRILHCFLGRVPVGQALPLVLDRCPRPPCLSRAGVELVQDSLAKGCTLVLARAGGWRRERYLRGDKVAEGRLWERTRPEELGLVFSREALRFLIWITAAQPSDTKPPWEPKPTDLTAADLLLLYLAYTALRETRAGEALKKRAPFAGNGLCRLAYPGDFTGNPANAAPRFTPWTGGVGACILEALQPALADHWVQAERSKAGITGWGQMQAVGKAQEAVLGPFCQAVESAGRPDLARFLLQAAASLLTEGVTAELWTRGLSSAGPRLADRVATYRAALAFVRQVDVWRQWERRARGVGYFDEGYTAAQLWKAEWERWDGDGLHARAQALARQVDPMAIGPGGTRS